MKAGVFFKENDLRVMEIDKPVPKDNEVLIKVMLMYAECGRKEEKA